MQTTTEILQEFKKITSKDIEFFFKRTISFLTNEYNNIVAYYSGDVDFISSVPFKIFDELKKERDSLFETIHLHSKQLISTKWWILIDQIEQIDSRFKTLDNINRWSRSSLTKVSYSPDSTVKYFLKQNQTLERVSSDILGSSNNDEWYTLALTNDLSEEDYSIEGGEELQLQFPKNNQRLQVNSVVDLMIDQNIYGKDLNRKLQFDSSTEDLSVLGNIDTISQSVDILLKLKKNDNPGFPNEGLQSSIIVGSNRATLNFPIITRQLTETFSTDDSLKDFAVKNISLAEDTLSLTCEVQSRLNEVFSFQSNIS